MKKLISLLNVLVLLAVNIAFADGEPTRVSALIGPTGMGMVKMMADEENSGAYAFSLASSADFVTPGLVRGEIDIACVPANLASVLCQRTGGNVQALAINTLGVLYIVERGETVKTVSNLKGRTVYASGKGATPEYALNYLLTANGLDPERDVHIEYKNEHAECLSALLTNKKAVAMLPQPFVTVARSVRNDLRVALDLNEEWEKLREDDGNPSALITGVVIARRAFAEEHPDKIADFLSAYESSVEFVNANPDEAAKLVGRYGIVAEDVAREAIPFCNIVCIRGEEMKTMLSGYLAVLCQQNPEAVGGQVPDESFYLIDG